MDARVAWLLGLTAAGVAVAAWVAVAAAKPATVPSPSTPAKCPPRAPGTVTGRAPVGYYASYPQTGTTVSMDVGDTLTVRLLRTGSTGWDIEEDDSSVLIGSHTTEPGSNGGTDDLAVFSAVGPGTTTVRGSGPGTFTLKVKVSCSG